MIKILIRTSIKQGVKPHQFSKWLHRKYGDLVVWRYRHDMQLGNSLPCVLCRNTIERKHIQWVAYTGPETGWIHSRKDINNIPVSKPTSRQRVCMNFRN